MTNRKPGSLFPTEGTPPWATPWALARDMLAWDRWFTSAVEAAI